MKNICFTNFWIFDNYECLISRATGGSTGLQSAQNLFWVKYIWASFIKKNLLSCSSRGRWGNAVLREKLREQVTCKPAHRYTCLLFISTRCIFYLIKSISGPLWISSYSTVFLLISLHVPTGSKISQLDLHVSAPFLCFPSLSICLCSFIFTSILLPSYSSFPFLFLQKPS